jgi:hypothetical protein
VAANLQSTQFKKIEYINEIWNKIKKVLNEADGKMITKKKDDKEITGLMKNVK